jgi:hypothetical protein
MAARAYLPREGDSLLRHGDDLGKFFCLSAHTHAMSIVRMHVDLAYLNAGSAHCEDATRLAAWHELKNVRIMEGTKHTRDMSSKCWVRL